ncbi:hypothetical protein PINS_up001934 [Pythium insidiosum]|nr:hypothetical protein PINS_up001934 [Pythium insidiosum]
MPSYELASQCCKAIIRRAKHTLLLIRPKRVFICRLLAVETLDHVTITRILAILKQLAQLDSAPAQLASTSSTSTGAKPAVDAHWKSLALVYVLVSCCDPRGRGMCPAAAEFLKENYAMKASATDTDDISSTPSSTGSTSSANISLSRLGRGINGGNALSSSGPRVKDKKKSEFKGLLNDAVGFDGCGIGTLLDTCETAQFCEIFNSADVRAADVLWGHRQRAMLFRYLKKTFVASSVTATNQIEDDDANGDAEIVARDEAIDDVFVGNIFLRSYIEGDGQFLNEWTPEMYQTLISALFNRLVDLSRTKSSYNMGADLHPPRSRPLEVEPWEVQVLILKALVKLLPTHCAAVEVTTEFYDTLLLPLRRSLLGETDQLRGVLAMELFVAILCVPETRSSNASTCRQYLETKGLSIIAEALEKMLNPTYQKLLVAVSGPEESNPARDLLYRITSVLSTLVAESKDGIRGIKRNHRVITALLDLCSKEIIMQHSVDAASACLQLPNQSLSAR